MKISKSILLLSSAIAMVACTNESFTEIEGPQQEVSFEGAERAFNDQTGAIKEGYFQGLKIQYEKVGDQKVFEGDILLDEIDADDTYYVLEEGEDRNLSKSVGRTSRRWPNNTVYYIIASDLPNKSRVTNAIASWENNTSLKFVKRTNQRNYINFRPGGGCSSSVGMVGGQQSINLASGCSTGNTIHEIGHAVGLWHEQSRADRNRYITINFQNIQSGKENNFRTYSEQRRDGDEYTSTLDFGSIMMYGPKSFSKNGRATIAKKDGSSYSVQRRELSSGDLQGISQMYPGSTGGGDGGGEPTEPTYTNGRYYTVNGLRVYRYNDSWYYYSSRNGWRKVVYRNGAWYYA